MAYPCELLHYVAYMNEWVSQGPICRGVRGFNPPNDFLTPVSVDLNSWGVDSNPSVSVTC